MADFYSHKKTRMFLYSPWFLTALGLASLFFLYSAFGTMQKSTETAKNKKLAESQLASLASDEIRLRSDIESLKTEEGLEKVIRSRFNVTKEGEGVILVVDAPVPAEAVSEKTGGFVNFFKNIFGKKKTKAN